MDLGSIFLLLGILLMVILYLIRPFLLHRATLVTQEEHTLSFLLAEKERLLNALKELEFDHILGKIPAEDYPLQRTALLAEAAEVIRQIENLRSQPISTKEPLHITKPQAQPRRPVAPELAEDDEIEALLAARRRQRAEKAGGFCPQCGKPVQRSDRFCSKCGTPLLVEVES
ncbi:MAG: zinc ribbon domain-containing protein [Anaerolineales bacterium]|nr:zinc ribbon domain-containing protein [Anaerolineales bacterium]MCS7248869.1 zinc ribbon domain-containing protein [Anaerolineales bacterium]MDW8162682.1 zinc ribbon domain-containing protein [Anaerolineales bacterium]MDW8447702.1 zinc ribbon domain-containing protein [Anaerolineales bacterium]